MNQLLTEKDFTTTNWSGGKTTELFIFHKESNFKDRNFSFRFSTASVEVEKTIFTPLPGIIRTLMVLDGEMELAHLKQHNKVLKKFDVDRFNGDWTTHSKGKCTAFNIMTKGKTEVTLEGVKLESNDEKKYQLMDSNKVYFIYLINGDLEVQSENEKRQLLKGGLLALDNPSRYSLLPNQIAEYVFIEIDFKY